MDHKNPYIQKVAELKQQVQPASSVLILTHDYPDPDCLASGVGLQILLSRWGVKTSQITFGGFIGRAENRAMIRFLNIPVVPLNLIEYADFEKIIVVDAFPGDANLSVNPKRKIDVVIDHHPHKCAVQPDFYCYIRSDIGSTSTIITQYLLAAECAIPTDVATALFYGIKTDTHFLSRHVSAEDLECYKYLFDYIDHKALSQIEAPDRDPEYFRILHRSTESMTVYNDTIGHIHLGLIASPDYIAEIADLFHSLESLEWMICSALFKNHIYYSIRTKNMETAGITAERIARSLNGSGGGHSHMAAGQIPIKNNSSIKNPLKSFVKAFKTTLGIEKSRGKTMYKESLDLFGKTR